MGSGTFQNAYEQLRDVILSLIFLVIFTSVLLPGLIIIFIPIYAWRLLLIGYVKLFRPEFVKILDGKNPVLAIDDVRGRPLCTIVGMGAFEGEDLDSFKDFVKNSVYASDPVSHTQFPELQQYNEEWMGFFWRRKEKKFSIDEHITIWNKNNERLSEDDLISIVEILEASPFPDCRSPWEVVLIGNMMLQGVKNSEKPKTIVMFRFHHSISDGVSFLQMLMRCVFTDTFDKVAKPVYVNRSAFQNLMFRIGAGLQLPYQFFKQGIDAADINDWHLPENRLSRQIHKAWSSRIPIKLLKEIKLRHNVGFTAVLVSAVSGALRRMMKRCNVTIPHKMHAIVPLPWPGHTQKLSNHWSYAFLELPVGIDEANKRLKRVHKCIETMKRSTVPMVNFMVLKFANLLPSWILRRTIVTNYLPTVILSNFPGPPSGSIGIERYPLVDAMFTGGPLCGISMTILSYDEGIRIVTGWDSAILPTQALTKEFIGLIEEEFQIMKSTPSLGNNNV